MTTCMSSSTLPGDDRLPDTLDLVNRMLPPLRPVFVEVLKMFREIVQAGEVVHRKEVVDIRQRGLNASSQRLVFR